MVRISLLLVLFGIVIAGCEADRAARSAGAGNLWVYADAYAYDGAMYQTIEEVRAALETHPGAALRITASTCAASARVEAALQLIENQANMLMAAFEEEC